MVSAAERFSQSMAGTPALSKQELALIAKPILNYLTELQMKLDDIDFCESGKPDKRGLGLFLPGHYWVAKKYFDLVWRYAPLEIPKLDWSQKQCAETIFGKARWKQFDFWEQLRLGRCVKYFVTQGMLPLRVANPGKAGKRLYVFQ